MLLMDYRQMIHVYVHMRLFQKKTGESQIIRNKVKQNHVGKVSTTFEYFASGFASLSVLTLIQVVLGAEFDSESNGNIFRLGFRSKNGTLPRNTNFFRFFRKVFGVRIRYSICVESKSGCVEFSIKFCVE